MGGQGQGHRQLHAELGHGLKGHVEVALALQRSGGAEDGGTIQKGKGVEEPGEELAGYVAGEGVLPWSQKALDSEHTVLLLIKDALLTKEVKIGPLRPFHQTAMTGEDAAAPHRQGNRDEEAEGGAGFAAVQMG